jgi:SseB protein C-terminal domain/SseB protein N-terminal domain
MAFEPENELEAALQRAVEDPQARVEFFRLLMGSPLLVLGRELPGGAGGRGQLSIMPLRHNGREFLSAFSSLTRLKAFVPQGAEHFTMEARPLFEATRGANFVLNPNSECGKMLMAAEIAFWLDPSARGRRNLLKASIRIGVPAIVPAKLVEALTVLFKNRMSVTAAYLAEATPLDGSEPPHPLIGIEHEGDWWQMMREVSELAAAVLPETIIDVIKIDRSIEADPLPAHVAEIPPFYQRATRPN